MNDFDETPNLFFVNLKGHAVTVLDLHGERVLALPSNGREAVIYHSYETEGSWLGNVPLKILSTTVVVREAGGRTTPFPEPERGKVYVVAAAVCARLMEDGRTDVYCPGPLVKDGSRTLGCVGLARHAGGEA